MVGSVARVQWGGGGGEEGEEGEEEEAGERGGHLPPPRLLPSHPPCHPHLTPLVTPLPLVTTLVPLVIPVIPVVPVVPGLQGLPEVGLRLLPGEEEELPCHPAGVRRGVMGARMSPGNPPPRNGGSLRVATREWGPGGGQGG